MGDQRLEREATRGAPEKGRLAASGDPCPPTAPDAPASEHEGDLDAAWTERMLNSLVAGGRRERGLVRDAHSNARNYVAFATVVRPLEGTSKGEIDGGTVEVPEREIPAFEYERLRAERAAPTVLVRRRRFPWRWVLVGLGATASLGAIWRNRPADVAVHVSEAARTEAPPEPAAPIADPTATTAPTDTVAPPSAAKGLERDRSTTKPAGAPAPEESPPAHAAPAPSGPEERAQSHRPFVDVVNRY